MKVKILFDASYRILSTMEGDECPAEEFLLGGDQNYETSRQGLLVMLEHVAAEGLENVPSKWFHEANKQEKVYEFIKGDLRLFFFKGTERDIAVCTGGVVKKTNKADKASVAKAASQRSAYLTALKHHSLEIIEDEQDQ